MNPKRLCDPPYNFATLYLYKDLAKVGSRVLKRGASLVVYAGQYHLPQVIDALQSGGLKYWWVFATKLNHYHALVHRKNVYSAWKPLLWFVKGDRPEYVDNLEDFIQSPEPKKAIHPHEQSVEEASYIINSLTVKNAIVLDCMMGSCTTGIAALANKRKFIGCEKDKSVFELAKRRVSQYLDYNTNVEE